MNQMREDLIYICEFFLKTLYDLKKQSKITEKEYNMLVETKIDFINKEKESL